MNNIIFYQATLNDIELLVDMRIKDLKMFSDKIIEKETIINIRSFFKSKLTTNECITILAFLDQQIIATGSIYYYDVMPSNENPTGKVGQFTNIWVDENYRGKGIAKSIIQQLMEKSNYLVGLYCLNSSKEATGMYEKLGFSYNEHYMIYKNERKKI